MSSHWGVMAVRRTECLPWCRPRHLTDVQMLSTHSVTGAIVSLKTSHAKGITCMKSVQGQSSRVGVAKMFGEWNAHSSVIS
ncbi:hypothetical protein TNCV_1542361 [Trichonephila clavipes]|nr:hypothetical protein TNCV_1542361 [Trichonephila clavipes]